MLVADRQTGRQTVMQILLLELTALAALVRNAQNHHHILSLWGPILGCLDLGTSMSEKEMFKQRALFICDRYTDRHVFCCSISHCLSMCCLQIYL